MNFSNMPMKKLLFLTLLLSAVVSFSQKTIKKYGSYQANLYQVDGADPSIFVLLDSTNSIYEDSLLRIDWKYNHIQMNFELTNLSNQTMRLIWDDAAFVSVYSKTSRVYHKATPYTLKEERQLPTVIYRNSKLDDSIVPMSYRYKFNGEWNGDWLIPGDNNLENTRKNYYEEFIGKSIRVILPIYIGDELIEYDFNFRIWFKESSSQNFNDLKK